MADRRRLTRSASCRDAASGGRASSPILLGGVAAVTTTAAVAATVDTSAWYVLENRNSGKAST